GQRLLHGRAWRHIFRTLGPLFWHRQRPPIHLPIRRQRQPVQRHQRRWQHIVRKPLSEITPHLTYVSNCPFPPHHISYQPLLSSSIFPRHYCRLLNLRMLTQRRLHFSRLDSVSTNLHLIVGSPHEFQVAISSPLHQVSRSIEPLASCLKRLRHEAFRRLFRPPDISPRHSISSDI